MQNPKRKNTCRVLLEHRDSDCIPAKQVLDDAERKVTLFKVNYLGRKLQLLTQHDEIRIGCNDAVIVLLRPIPDRSVIRLLQTNIADVHNLAIEFEQTGHEPGREIFVEEQLHPRFVLRPASAANW